MDYKVSKAPKGGAVNVTYTSENGKKFSFIFFPDSLIYLDFVSELQYIYSEIGGEDSSEEAQVESFGRIRQAFIDFLGERMYSELKEWIRETGENFTYEHLVAPLVNHANEELEKSGKEEPSSQAQSGGKKKAAKEA